MKKDERKAPLTPDIRHQIKNDHLLFESPTQYDPKT